MSFPCMTGIKRKAAAILALLLLTFVTHAQDTAANVSSSSVNWLEILLIATAVVLVFVIWGMAQVVLILAKKIHEKHKASLTKLTTVIIGLFAYTNTQAQDIAVVPSNYGGISSLEFWALASVIFIEVVAIFVLAFLSRRMYRALTGKDDVAPTTQTSSNFAAWWKQLDEKFMTQAVPMEKEADVLLDHDYDGIKELDNALPPWWKYGFYITVAVAILYIFNFHVFEYGKDPEQEYLAEMEQGKKMEEAYKAKTKNLVDENNIVLADAVGIAEGQAIYKQSCVACHGQNGEGGIGPNLTDEYWLHGAAMNDIYKTIKLGYPEKGMQSWESMFTPVQIKNLASYVKSIKGTKPANAKAPQGERVSD